MAHRPRGPGPAGGRTPDVTVIEATGGSLSCHRCGRALPSESAQQARWGSFFMQARLVLLACPDCLSDAEREQIADREGDTLWEVASARAASAVELRGIAAQARERGHRAPPGDWLAALSEEGRHVGVLAGEPSGDVVLALWSGETADGSRLPVLLELEIGRWMELEERYVPYWVQTEAVRVAREQGASPR